MPVVTVESEQQSYSSTCWSCCCFVKRKTNLSSSTGGSSKSSEHSLDQFRTDVLKRHNVQRAKHGSPPLVLSASLNKFAQEWAEKLAQTGTFRHRQNNQFGENIFYAMRTSGEVSATEAVDSWYSEIQDYNFNGNSPSPGTGHFTQVIWKFSRELGIGRAKAAGGAVYIVTNYNPPGNFSGAYKENVRQS